MFSWLFGWKGLAIGGAAFFLIGSWSGWSVRDAFCDAAAAKAEVAALQRQLLARDEAAIEDRKRAEADAETKAQLEGAVRDLEVKISAGECLSADDTDSLRSLWKR